MTYALRKLGLGSAAAALLLAPAAGAHAEGWYAGVAGSVSETRIETGAGWFAGPSAGGYELSGGYRVADHFAVDLALLRAPDLGWTLGMVDLGGSTYRAATTFDATAVQAAAVGVLPFGRYWEASGKVGVAHPDMSGVQTLRLTPTSAPLLVRTVAEDGLELVFGIGIGATIAQKWHVRAEIQSIRIESAWLGTDSDASLDSWTAGFEYRFGAPRRCRSAGQAASCAGP